MSVAARVATGVVKAVFYCSLGCLAVWLLWYGQYQWAGYDCKMFKQGRGGHPSGWALSGACALRWTRPLLQANVGFLFGAPAVAALAAIAIMGLRKHPPGSGRVAEAKATLQSWGSTMIPPRSFWLWFCDSLTVKDVLIMVIWAAYNAVWYSTILTKALSRVTPGLSPSPRLYAKSFASLMMPNIVPLMFPVSRGSVINNALGVSYPEGIRYHRWLGQWVLLLVSLHGLIYWISWAANGVWVAGALRTGAETNNLLGGVALICALVLWATSQEAVRRWWYSLYKPLHHLGFWGFMLLGVAHHWSLFWYFVPGIIIYAVDGVFRLHQAFAGKSGDLCANPTRDGVTGINTEVLKVDVDPSAKMCSLLLSAPEFGAAPAGIVWLNVPSLSVGGWHAFDYTASEVVVGADGRVCNAYNSGKGVVEGQSKTALCVHIKAYSRWSRELVTKLSQGEHKLSIRIQGPYADPPSDVGQPDGVVLVAGGNGIASALPVFEELSAAGVSTQGLPALLVWACRKGYEFEHMAAPVLAAARALGLNLTLHLHITDGVDVSHVKGLSTTPDTRSDTTPYKDNNSTPAHRAPVFTLAVQSTGSSEADSDIATPAPAHSAYSKDVAVVGAIGSLPAVPAAAVEGAAAGPSGLCPVVAFASFAAQLSFKAILHLVVFGGFLLGLFVVTYVGGARQVAAGKMPWETAHLGPALVLIPAGISVGLGLITLWIGLFIQRRSRSLNRGLGGASRPAAAIAAASGKASQLTAAAAGGQKDGIGASAEAASLLLRVPTMSGAVGSLPVCAERPDVCNIMHGWLRALQQLPAAATASADKAPARLNCVVYGCGPTPLDHATQLAVASFASKQKGRGEGGVRPVQLQLVRKAQML